MEHLADRRLLRIDGPEAAHFLQMLVTCDVEGLADGEATFGALLTPQGKILFDFLVVREGTGFLIDTLATQADALRMRLTFYKLRAAVVITDDTRAVVVSRDGAVVDPRGASLGARSYLDNAPISSAADWHARRVAGGVAECGVDYEPSSTFPHEANMDQFAGAGVAFTKGCYVGQEVVSRMQHRGTARSRFVIVEGESLPALGAELTVDGRAIGTMGSHAGTLGLALVRLDRAAAARDDIRAGGSPVTLRLAPFVGYDWPA